jgi:NitT/TauT family transport system substrate-binding protein
MNRRTFLRRTALAGTVGLGLAGWRPGHTLAEPPPETTRLRFGGHVGAICAAPGFVAEDLFAAEGFTDIQYVRVRSVPEITQVMAAGETDLGMQTILPTVLRLDAGDPLVLLGGVHLGCYELFGTDRVRSIHDLKGKTVAVGAIGGGDHAYISIMAAYVGLDPRKDISWVVHPPGESKKLLTEGKIDAYMAFGPDPHELRAKKIGRMVVSTTADRPWSLYFCCMALGNREFVRKHPVATKRFLRALLKATDICGSDPERAARLMLDKKYTQSDYTLNVLRSLPYGKWREYDPADTVRFAALRLHEVGMIKSSPQRIMSEGTNWSFINELKKELKG